MLGIQERTSIGTLKVTAHYMGTYNNKGEMYIWNELIWYRGWGGGGRDVDLRVLWMCSSGFLESHGTRSSGEKKNGGRTRVYRRSVYISRGSLRYGGAGLGSRILKSEAEVNWKRVELFEEVTCGWSLGPTKVLHQLIEVSFYVKQ